MEVSRTGYYDWSRAEETVYEQRDVEFEPLVKDVFLQHKRRYGARRIVAELKDQGVMCCRKKVRKTMEKLGLYAIQPKSFKPRSTESRHTLGYNPNLLLTGIDVTSINQVWVGDITYISLPSKFAYLAILLDLFSRKIVGWSLDLNMEASLVIGALKQAIKLREPSAQLIHHTDRGGQYAAKEYRKILSRCNMQQSMSRAADCYDNAFMESCFGTIKTELEMDTYQSIEEAQRVIEEYINYYNTVRRHSSLDYLSPNRFELKC
jgi:transposase InsO family protein